MTRRVRLDREQLLKREVCAAARALFDSVAGEAAVIEWEWEPAHALLLASLDPTALRWLQAHRVLPLHLNLAGMDLRGADLSVLDARFLDLEGAQYDGTPPSGWRLDHEGRLRRGAK